MKMMRLKQLKKEQLVKNKLSMENKTELFMLSQQKETNKGYHRKAHKILFK